MSPFCCGLALAWKAHLVAFCAKPACSFQCRHSLCACSRPPPTTMQNGPITGDSFVRVLLNVAPLQVGCRGQLA